jgi:acyl carrier protein
MARSRDLRGSNWLCAVTPEDIVAQTFGIEPEAVKDDSGRENVEEWDSLGHMNLVMEIEEVYGVALSTDDALEIVDVASLKRILLERGATW